jgi:hypothetical protein
MKTWRYAIGAIVLLACTLDARAHEIDPGGRIEVNCAANSNVRMAEIARAVEISHYWAPQLARLEMLSLAREACAKGAKAVAFVPPDDQRYRGNGRD